MTPSKGLSFEHRNTPRFHMKSIPQQEGLFDAAEEVENYRRIKLKVRAPLWLGKSLKAFAGVRYETEQLIFEHDGLAFQPVLGDVGNTNLKKVGVNLTVLKAFRGRDYLVLRGALNYSGAFGKLSETSSDHRSINVSALWGHRKNNQTEYGFGLNFNHGFNLWNLYPVVLYNHNFNKRWGIEALLPKQLLIRRNMKDNSMLSALVELEGNRYFIPQVALSTDRTENLVMQVAEIKTGISYQRPIISFLWFGIEAGYRKNLNFDFALQNARRNDDLFRSDVTAGLYGEVSFFITPPKSLVKK